MSTEYKVLIVEAPSQPPAPVQVTLETLRDAILKHPDLALDALRIAIQGGAVEPPQVGGTQLGGNMPLDTPIFKMVSPEQAKLLSAAAAKLTKEDLVDLATKKKSAADLNLTVDDMKTINDAFHAEFTNAPAGLRSTVSCCCCTPCCCCTAAAVTEPIRRVA